MTTTVGLPSRQAAWIPWRRSTTKTGHDAWNGWRGRRTCEERRPTAWVGSRAVAFLRGRSGHVGVKAPDIAAAASISRPWFLKVSFHRPHSPYDPPSRLLDQVHAEDLPPVAMCSAAGGGTTAKAPKTPPDSSRYVGRAWCLRYRGNLSLGDPGGCGADSWANPAINQSGDDRDMWCGEGRDKAAVALGRRAYLASVAFVDEQVGLMMQALRETGLVASTLLLWVSDHGDGQETISIGGRAIRTSSAHTCRCCFVCLIAHPQHWCI